MSNATSMPAAAFFRRPGGPRSWEGGPLRPRAVLARISGDVRDPLFLLTALLFTAALLFGGASRENALQLGLLELLSLPVIPLAVARLRGKQALDKLAFPLIVLAVLAAWGALQLIPLPFELWRMAPGHEPVAAGLQLAGAAPRFLPLSLTPAATRQSLLALLIPMAVLLGAGACSTGGRRALVALVIAAAAVSLFLSVLQMAGGADSPLRFYPTTNRHAAVGLFANRNHLAAFLTITLPLMTVWIRDMPGERAQRVWAMTVSMLSMFGAVMVGVAITQSRAGILLVAPALLGSIALIWRGGSRGRAKGRIVGLSLVVLAVVAAVMFFALNGIVRRFAPGLESDYRMEIWPTVAAAAMRFSPFGAGLGSLEPVYRVFEKVSLMSSAFVNHAHNDYLEAWLEAGWVGAGLVLAMLGWIVRRSVQAWLRTSTSSAALAQAASVVLLLLALHSFVDYPLRTPTMAATAALMCACLARQGARSGRTDQ